MKFQTIDEAVISSVHQSFLFLEKDCGYTRTEEYRYSKTIYLRSNYVVTYINNHIKKQIEIALLINGTNVEIEIARFKDGIIEYDNRNYYISFDDLYYLLEPPVFESNFYQACLYNRIKAIQDAGRLISGFRDILCTDDWFDVNKIKHLEIERYKKKWDIDIGKQRSEVSIDSIIKSKLTFLIDEGYSLTLDSDKLPFYERNTWVIIYKNTENEIIIFKSDPRDEPSFYVEINGKKQKTSYKNAFDEKIPDHIAFIVKEAL